LLLDDTSTTTACDPSSLDLPVAKCPVPRAAAAPLNGVATLALADPAEPNQATAAIVARAPIAELPVLRAAAPVAPAVPNRTRAKLARAKIPARACTAELVVLEAAIGWAIVPTIERAHRAALAALVVVAALASRAIGLGFVKLHIDSRVRLIERTFGCKELQHCGAILRRLVSTCAASRPVSTRGILCGGCRGACCDEEQEHAEC